MTNQERLWAYKYAHLVLSAQLFLLEKITPKEETNVLPVYSHHQAMIDSFTDALETLDVLANP
ncbi:hypothetical protein CJD36_003735 [Flavipsychrobacter stenotrophus]|uniref:Uncharacterized protein n=1 Tax=Flavipsychrobacter stenotrophus TaxID=2077091 RepID=A0A2S7T290_9BACT|nr:hypothetical protein [Flavipsychrobacter stenotrophus]PQJ12866.1 hypothetical protein CJD36_003735 [Flavipsychrobacter stenotrophus]